MPVFHSLVLPETTSNSISSTVLQSPTPSFATVNTSPTHPTSVLVAPPQALQKSLSAKSSASERDGYQPSSLIDSDTERHKPSSPLLECYRHASLKGQGSQRPVIRGGKLPLPSRSQTPSRLLNRGATAPSGSRPHENRPPLQSVIPLQSLRQATDPPPFRRAVAGGLPETSSRHSIAPSSPIHIAKPLQVTDIMVNNDRTEILVAKSEKSLLHTLSSDSSSKAETVVGSSADAQNSTDDKNQVSERDL